MGQLSGANIVTVEGVQQLAGGVLHPVQAAMHAADGLQCGYCIPGFVMSACALFARNQAPSAGELDDALAGNLCRCGSQPHIVQALRGLSASGAKR